MFSIIREHITTAEIEQVTGLFCEEKLKIFFNEMKTEKLLDLQFKKKPFISNEGGKKLFDLFEKNILITIIFKPSFDFWFSLPCALLLSFNNLHCRSRIFPKLAQLHGSKRMH